MEKEVFISALRDVFIANCLGEYLSDDICGQFYTLYELLVDYNKRINLTAITAPEEVILKHFADSLTLAKRIPQNANLIDIGCGGGFPALPLAVVRKDISVTAVDSVAKKVNFINFAKKELLLDNIVPVAARVEELARNEFYREKFDISCARAVARLNILIELCVPFLKVGGKFLAMKTDAQEIDFSANALKKLNAGVLSSDSFYLNASNGEKNNRCIIEIRKNSCNSDIYPRKYALISKNPL